MGSVHVFRTAEIWEDLRKFKPFFYFFSTWLCQEKNLYSLRTSLSSFPPVAKDSQLRQSIPIWDTRIVRGQVIGPERSTKVGQQWDAIEEVTRAGPDQFVYMGEARVHIEQALTVLGLTSTVIPCSLHSMATAPRMILSNTQNVECVPSLLPAS